MPDISVYVMGSYICATIGRDIDYDGANLAARWRTQLVIATDQDSLYSRCKSVLVSEFGLEQDEADALVPGGMVPLVPAPGIPEAPSDGTTYGRLNAAWSPALPATTQIPAASTTNPAMDGTAAPGSGMTWARGDHVHPVDVSRYAANNPSGYQTVAQVTAIAHAGTTTNDSAAAGQIGEYLGVQRLSTAGVALANNVDATITTLPLTAGDWDVWGSGGLTMVNGNGVTLRCWINAAGAGQPSIDQMGGNAIEPTANNVPQAIVPLTPMRVSIAGATTVTLGVNCTFSGGTISAWGKLMARRAR
jgi:hypothetical protein